jgi:hypothetical protein
LTISKLFSRHFQLENSGNGNSFTLALIAKSLELQKGNGNTRAKELIAQKYAIKCSGNGNVYVTVLEN